MALYKRGRIWWISFTDPAGRLIRRSTKQSNKKEATAVWVRLQASLLDGTYKPEPERPALECPTFEIALESYLQDREARGMQPQNYRRLADVWGKAFKGRRLDTISAQEVERVLHQTQSARSWSPATRNNALSQLSGLLTYAYRIGWIDKHPTRGRGLQVPVNNERQRWLRRHEIDAIKAEAEPWLQRIIDLAVNTGLRLGRICELRRSDYRVDDQGMAYIFVARDKNGEAIWKGVHGPFRELVERRVGECRFPGDYLFPGPRGGFALGSINKWFPRAVKAAARRHTELCLEWGCTKDGITFHTLRHYPEHWIIPSRGARLL